MSDARCTWKVVGGIGKGGILVRQGCGLTSGEVGRLATDAFVLQLELVGERLYYERLSGAGPDTGWVSVQLKHKVLLEPLAEEGPQPKPTQLGALEAGIALPKLQGPSEVRICTWNILAPCYHRDLDGKKEVMTKFWQPRVALQLSAVLGTASPDILCLQELWWSPTVLSMVKDVAKTRGYEASFCRRSGQKMDGVAVLIRDSKFRFVASEEQEICSMGNRVVLWLLLRSLVPEGVSEDAIVLGTTHFTFPHGDQEEEQRFRQSKEAKAGGDEFVRRHGLPESVPQVFAGDLNCESGPADDEALDVLLSAGWRSVFSEVHGREPSATHRTHRGNHSCADFVLLRGKVRAAAAVLLPAEEPDSATIPRPKVGGAEGLTAPRTLHDWSQLSDHRPLVATLELGQARGISGSVEAPEAALGS